MLLLLRRGSHRFREHQVAEAGREPFDLRFYPRAHVDGGAGGDVSGEEQAGLLGCAVEDIYQARDTLKRYARQIREDYDQAEERRMKELRGRSGTKLQENAP